MAEEFERRSPVFDWEIGDFVRDTTGNVVTVTEGQAVEQILIKALQTARGVDLIYANLEDEDLDFKYGSDIPRVIRDHDISREVKEDEIRRSIEEALIYLDWVESVDDIEFTAIPGKIDAIEVSCSVTTIFDQVITLEGVEVNG